ncbi:MAG TPA: 2-oxoglutarate dehydrogenase complex dihydrolipoyllysine-residue succinyltransferase [Opitutaceae bacterium]|nr:2-oxoglutarate dehydrogenase complex dihydrolipoyllysine-residue succinyltransferase [Opitutaceae bacterium]
MSLPVKIPPLGESIVSGILAKWHVANGASVKKGQALFELETDKITSEGTAEADGVITLAVPEGAEVKIGAVVATIEVAAGAKPETGDRKPESPVATATPATVHSSPSTASPAVRRLAEETKIDPATIAGTGKAGRVTKGDMLAAAEARGERQELPDRPATTPASTNPQSAIRDPQSTARATRRKMTPLRAKIAERLVQAKNQTAMLTTFNEVDMTAVRDLRARYQDDFTKRHGIKLGFMSFFVKAAVHALREVPAVNASLDGDTIVQNNYFDIGVAVSTDRGLMVPTLRDCDTHSLAQLEKDIAAYAVKARDGKIALDDLTGGVFTITNGGTFGSLLSTPILNPPQCGILGMHAIQDRPVARDGQVVIRPMMYLALSYDHRLVDGKEAVTFLVKVKQAIEDPARLLLGV